jgi:hypothetical protein
MIDRRRGRGQITPATATFIGPTYLKRQDAGCPEHPGSARRDRPV